MEKCNQSEKAVEYIANQIEKLEKNVNEYNYNINSIELELNDKSKMLSEIYYISHGLWLYCSKHLSLYCWNKLNSYWKNIEAM